MIESSFDPHDHSHAGAVGLWQFMPDNSKIYGLRVDYWIDERRNPEKATAAWVRYISDLRERFGGWPMTLAAFNAGYGAVLRAMQKYNTNDYWELCKHEDGLPWETTLYVPKVMATALVGENRALFGYESIKPDAAYAFDRVTVPTSMSLAAIAKAAGVAVAEVTALNPELRRSRTPPEAWEVRLPSGSGQRFASAYDQHKELVKPYVVRFGERLDDLAATSGITARELRTLNGIEDSAEVRPGLTLVVPAGRKPLASPAYETAIVAVPDKDAVVAGRKRIFYRTLPQDTTADIASFFKVKPIDLAKWNNLDLDAKLCGSMVLQVWVAPDLDLTRAALVDPTRVRVVTTGSTEFFDLVEARRGRKRVTYVVKAGDDLKRIGKKFNLTVADLERINRFGAARTDIVVGQKLTVYVAMSAAEKAKAAASITPGGLERPTAEEPTTAAVATGPAAATATATSAPASDQLPPVGGELEQARRALSKSSDDSDKEATPARDDDGDDAGELPRPPPSDGHP
jgi:membrane-bound lytic murein transglycosylase D